MTVDKKLKNFLLLTSILLFLFSLTQKCYCTTSTCSDSIIVFILGWAAIFTSGAGLVWFANPLLIFSWFMLKRNLKTSMFVSVFASLISLSFLLFETIIDNEGGGHNSIISYKSGYWTWVASSMVMMVGTFVLMFRHNSKNIRQ